MGLVIRRRMVVRVLGGIALLLACIQFFMVFGLPETTTPIIIHKFSIGVLNFHQDPSGLQRTLKSLQVNNNDIPVIVADYSGGYVCYSFSCFHFHLYSF